jgi:flagellar protein FlgJ
MIPIGSIASTQALGAPSKAEAPDPKLLQAAKDFESIFVRQMLKSLEKTTAAGGGTKPAAGQHTYGSMIVDTLSESISKAGGLGLADVIAQSMIAAHPGLTAPAREPHAASNPSTSLNPLRNPLK